MNNGEFYLADAIEVIDEILAGGGEFRMYPKGTSMLPLIKQGIDSVVLKRNFENGANKRDIAFYRRDNGQFVLHRIVKVKKNGYVMCGDNQYELEYGITDKHILAKMKAVVRDGVVIDENDKKYKKYVKRLPFRRFKKKIRIFLGKTKARIFNRKKAV